MAVVGWQDGAMESQTTVPPQSPPPEKPQAVAAYKTSGLSLRAFARQKSLPRSTLHRWVCQEREAGQSGHGELVEVPNLLGGGQGAYRLHFPGGLMLEVARGFKPEELRTLVQVLQSL